MSAVQFCPSAPYRFQGLTQYKRESFFCFLAVFLPNLSLLCGCGFHVSVICSPYAYSFLPCIRAGAPVYTIVQRLPYRHQSSLHSSSQVISREEASGSSCALQRGQVAGASYVAGAAGAQGGAPAPLPAPLLQERQGKRSWPTARPVVFHGSFHAPRSRGGLPAPKCRGFFGFCSVGIWEENGASNSLKVFVAALAQVVEVRHDG